MSDGFPYPVDLSGNFSVNPNPRRQKIMIDNSKLETLTEKEESALCALRVAWNAFVSLPVEHPDDVNEFRRGLHILQGMVLARPVRRALNPTARRVINLE